jgi:hypothetical protein
MGDFFKGLTGFTDHMLDVSNNVFNKNFGNGGTPSVESFFGALSHGVKGFTGFVGGAAKDVASIPAGIIGDSLGTISKGIFGDYGNIIIPVIIVGVVYVIVKK